MTRLADALQDCLDAVSTGRARVDECPSRYPELAADLEPLLRVCQRLQEAFSVEPSPRYTQAARERFLADLASRRRPHATAHRCAPPRSAKAAPADSRSSPATPASPAASTSEE
jgi:hypothetical protein